MKHFLFYQIFLILLFMVLSIGEGWGAGSAEPEIRQGVLDLRNWDFYIKPVFELHGEWEFFWNKLVRPEDLAADRSLVNTGFIEAPKGWNGQKVGKITIPDFGYGTYHLVILLPEEKTVYGFKLSEMDSAYEFWVNGKLQASGGRVSTNISGYSKDSKPRIFYYQPDNDRLDILIPVCNYEDWTGGMVRKLEFGLQSAISAKQENERAMELLLFGIFFISGFYHLWFFLLRKKDSYHFFFGLLCFLFSFKTLFEGTKNWFFFFPDFNTDYYLKLWFINYFFLIPVTISFLKSFYPNEYPQRIIRLFMMLASLFSVIVLVFPQSINVYALNAYHFVTLTGLLLAIAGVILAFIRKKQFAALVLITGLFLVAGTLNDLLFGMNIIKTGFISQFCLIGFIFSESIIISSRSAKAFEINETMMRDLEKIVEQRTLELRLEKSKLELQNGLMLEELEMARRIQLQLIPQEDPFSSIASFYQPMQKVGGDFYDYIRFHDSNKLGIFLSDVSGHGVPAAFVTVLIKSAILQSGKMREDPAVFLLNLNEFLLNNTASHFVTAFYGIVDFSKKTFVYSNAGHNSPFLLVSDNLTMLNSEKRGMPLGIFDEPDLQRFHKVYQNEEISLEKKSKILFYTDGLTEAANPAHPHMDFEQAKLKDILVRIKQQKPKRFIEILRQALIEYRGLDSFDDDVCMICLEV